MAVFADCIGCQSGQHDLHRDVPVAAPVGGVGGQVCPCTGDCAERNANQVPEPLASMLTAFGWFPFEIPEEAIEAAYDAADAQFPSSAQGRWLRPAIEEALKAAMPFLRFAPLGDNHHNAARCPYCTPRAAPTSTT